MGTNITGGCQCGAIRYVISEDPAISLICHCRQCQKITGTGHAAQFSAPTGSTSLQGSLSYFDMTSDSGNIVKSGFCAKCGSPILKIPSLMKDTYFVHAGSLDDPSAFKPSFVVFDHARPAWDHVDEALDRK